MPVPFVVTQEARNIHTVTLDATDRGQEWSFLLSSDRHHDSTHCNRDLEIRHLQQCVERGAGICDFGDMGCLMQGRYDPRRARKGIRDEDMDAVDYLDSVIRHAAEFYAPFAGHFVVIGRGNHEQSVLKNNDSDYTERVCERMSMLSKVKVHPGGYGGWIRFRVQFGNERYAMSLKYFHGAGGGALMSHGTLQVRRHGAVMPDADVVCTGHIHRRWIMPMRRERLVSDRHGCRVEQDTQYHICTGTYKDEFGDHHSGWANEKGMPPHDMGAVWMTLRMQKETMRSQCGKAHTRYALVPSFVLTD